MVHQKSNKLWVVLPLDSFKCIIKMRTYFQISSRFERRNQGIVACIGSAIYIIALYSETIPEFGISRSTRTIVP